MLLILLDFMHVAVILICFGLPFLPQRSWRTLLALTLIGWLLAIAILELALYEASLQNVVVEGDGAKTLFAWFIGWLPQVLSIAAGEASALIVLFAKSKLSNAKNSKESDS